MTLRSTTFTSASGYTTVGTGAIVRQGAAHRVELRDDFATSFSNALDVRLCTASNCSGARRVLGTLQRHSGSQAYALDDDASGFSHLVIWCNAVNLPFGFGELR